MKESDAFQAEPISKVYHTVLVLDFGSQYSHLITRRVREMGVYCEMLACTAKISELDFTPTGVILSGGPYSVYDTDAPHVDPKLWDLKVPVLGICYGLQEIAHTRGGQVAACTKREYGKAVVTVDGQVGSPLFEGVPDEHCVWMSHGDQLKALPKQFVSVAHTSSAPYAGIQHEELPIYGIQFHPEVTHTEYGVQILKNFVLNICNCTSGEWSMSSFIEKELSRIRTLVGPTEHVIGAVSGGVDSTVAAALMTRAIGDRFHAVLVDNGLMRLNEVQQVQKTMKDGLGINLAVADAADLFLSRLSGVTDPEKKRKIIGNTFIHIFEAKALEIEKKLELSSGSSARITFLLQGTLYPDVIESISFKGPSSTIKTHHNVGGLLDNMKLKLVEPLRELFKDEVRKLGALMDIPEDLVWRHPFPGPGLAIRILGEITTEQLEILRQADDIFISEIKKAGLYRLISQAYAALLPIRSVGVMGDNRTYEQVIALRAVTTTDFMTADWFDFPTPVLRSISSRIINEVKGVNRCVYDISSKPPSTIEWE